MKDFLFIFVRTPCPLDFLFIFKSSSIAIKPCHDREYSHEIIKHDHSGHVFGRSPSIVSRKMKNEEKRESLDVSFKHLSTSPLFFTGVVISSFSVCPDRSVHGFFSNIAVSDLSEISGVLHLPELSRRFLRRSYQWSSGTD